MDNIILLDGLLTTLTESDVFKRWYKSLLSRFAERAKQQFPPDPDAYWSGVDQAAGLMRELVAIRPPEPVEPMSFWTEIAGLDPTDSDATNAVDTIVRSEALTVLPPRPHTPEGVREGVHIALSDRLAETDQLLERPVLYISGHGISNPQSPVTLVLDAGNGNFQFVDQRTLVRRVADINDDRLLAAIEHGPATKQVEAALVRSNGIDLFGPDLPAGEPIRGYRLHPAMEPSVANQIVNGHKLFQAAREVAFVRPPEIALELTEETAKLDVNDPDARRGVEDVLATFAHEKLAPANEVQAALRDLVDVAQARSLTRELVAIRSGMPAKVPTEERRILSAECQGTIFTGRITVIAWIALATQRPSSATHSPEFIIDTSEKVVLDMCYEGFTTDDPTWIEIPVPPGKPSVKVACQFTFADSERHAITVVARQNDAPLGQVHFDNFTQDCSANRAMTSGSHAFDVLIKVDNDGTIRLTSSDGKGLGTTMSKKLPMRDDSGAMLNDTITMLLTADLDDTNLDFQLRRIGHQVSDALPEQLVKYLQDNLGRDLLIDHPMTTTFPFELAMLKTPTGPQYLGEVHRVTRWISTAGCDLPSGTHPIAKAAFVWGTRALQRVEDDRRQHLEKLRSLCPTEPYDTLTAVREAVLKTNEYGVIDFVTHLGAKDNRIGLEIGDGWLRAIDFFDEYEEFADSVALVVINACDSIQNDHAIFEQKSFPDELLRRAVPSVIASFLPVKPSLALRFGDLLFDELASGAMLGRALVNARQRLRDDDGLAAPAALRRAATLAYCAFGSPRMSFTFPANTDRTD